MWDTHLQGEASEMIKDMAQDRRLDRDIAGLNQRARDRWRALSEVRVRCRDGFAYVDGVLADQDVIRLCRLRYAGSALMELDDLSSPP